MILCIHMFITTAMNTHYENTAEKLYEYYTLYPYLNPENDEKNIEMEAFAHEYDEIIKLGK